VLETGKVADENFEDGDGDENEERSTTATSYDMRVSARSSVAPPIPTWNGTASHTMFTDNYITKEKHVLDVQNEALRNYRSIFRTTFPELAPGELKYTKQNDKERRFSAFNIRLGIKFGIILSVFGALFVNALLFRNLSPIWKSYGLNVYSALGTSYHAIIP
jgi:hypothetical protein